MIRPAAWGGGVPPDLLRKPEPAGCYGNYGIAGVGGVPPDLLRKPEPAGYTKK